MSELILIITIMVFICGFGAAIICSWPDLTFSKKTSVNGADEKVDALLD